jgi:Calcium/calmodulin dependent protein kinase II Association.
MEELEDEALEATQQLLEAVYRQDAEYYRAHATEDMSAYEWFIAPGRIDGVDFHLHLTAAGGMTGVSAQARVDLIAPRVQIVGASNDVAIVTFTLLVTYPGGENGKATFYTDNQTRVLVKDGDGIWKMVHFHRSPTH